MKNPSSEPVPPELQIDPVAGRTSPAELVTNALVDTLKAEGYDVIGAERIEGHTVLYLGASVSSRFQNLLDLVKERSSALELLCKPGDKVSESKSSTIFALAVLLRQPQQEPEKNDYPLPRGL